MSDLSNGRIVLVSFLKGFIYQYKMLSVYVLNFQERISVKCPLIADAAAIAGLTK